MKVRKDGKFPAVGSQENVFSEQLCIKIRERLSLTPEQLPSKTIKKLIKLYNKELGLFIISNAEGFMTKDCGTFAPSKHLPKELRVDKEEVIAKIMLQDVSELGRQQVLKRYDVDMGRRIDLAKLAELKEKIPHLNLETYFYTYRLMWFNHRNCKSRKAQMYEFKPTQNLNRAFAEKIWDGKQFFEWNFNDFYGRKVKATY